MSLQHQLADRSNESPSLAVPTELDTPTAKLVYLYLSVTNEATIGQVRDDLGLTQLTLLPTISALEREGLLNRSSENVQIAE